MHPEEVRDLLISIIVLSIALTNISGFDAVSFGTSVLTVIFCFLVHELAHRNVAKYYGFSARYVAWPIGLGIALLSSFFGFIFAAPGAVYISPYSERFAFQLRPMTRKESGIISLAGPLSNLIVGALMLLVYFHTHFFVFLRIAKFSFWLAFFNLLPIPPLDGSKVLIWNPLIWLLALLCSFALMQVLIQVI